MRPSLTGSCTTSSSLTCEQLHCVYACFVQTGSSILSSSVTVEQAGLCSRCPWQRCFRQVFWGLAAAQAGCLGVTGIPTYWLLQDNPASAPGPV